MNSSESDDLFVQGYNEYLKYVRACQESGDRVTEMYTNGWYVITGRSIIAPHPHRPYLFLEFVYHCGRDRALYTKFIGDDRMREEVVDLCRPHILSAVVSRFKSGEFVNNVCLSYRHDFGLMPEDGRNKLLFECREWMRAITNNWEYHRDKDNDAGQV